MRNGQNKDRGQAIAIIALAFVALIAFTGLAIDGGMVYSDRRHAQNASDAGSLAGGGKIALDLENANIDHLNFKCANPANAEESAVVNAVVNAEAAAVQAAELSMVTNGYTATNFTVTTNCVEGNSTFQHYIDITTTITKETNLAFVKVVYDDTFVNVVDATTRLRPRHPIAYGNAIVALNPDNSCNNASSGGIKFGGTGMVVITGGGVWSDGCLVGQGNCNVTVEGPGISYVGGNFGVCPVMNPGPVSADEPMDEDSYLFTPPICTPADREDDIRVHNNQVLDLNPGYGVNPNVGPKLICLTETGDAIRMNGGELIGYGVTIYLEGGGDITINGGVVKLEAPPPGDDDGSGPIPGVVIYSDAASDINIEGNHESHYTGLIYAPAADIKITGEGDIGPTFNTQIIGYNITMLGTSGIDINFNDSWVYTDPTALDMQE